MVKCMYICVLMVYVLCLNDYRTQVHAGYDSNGLTACEQEQIARQIFYPKSGHEMHVSRVFINMCKIEYMPWYVCVCTFCMCAVCTQYIIISNYAHAFHTIQNVLQAQCVVFYSVWNTHLCVFDISIYSCSNLINDKIIKKKTKTKIK